MHDFKAQRWAHDINSFTRWQIMLARIIDNEGDFWDQHRARIRTYMLDIQKRWPQFIKIDEIP